jgi:hypothetical protein
LTAWNVADDVVFCEKMLSMTSMLPKIHFSDESRVIIGDDEGWIWSRAGEENPEASIAVKKFRNRSWSLLSSVCVLNQMSWCWAERWTAIGIFRRLIVSA